MFYTLELVNTITLLLAFAYYYQEGKDIIVFRFIIEYSSLRDFGLPLGNNNRSMRIFER
jgi:hypothetical protein